MDHEARNTIIALIVLTAFCLITIKVKDSYDYNLYMRGYHDGYAACEEYYEEIYGD